MFVRCASCVWRIGFACRFWVVCVLVLCGCFTTSQCAYAQMDSPLSHRFDLPILLNPANAGLGGGLFGENKSNHNFRLNYKSQLTNAFNNNSLKILSGSYQGRFFNKQMALGLSVYSNTLNNAALRDLSVMLTYAYHWTIDRDAFGDPSHLLSFGVQAGVRRWAVDMESLRTNSMYDPSYSGGFNPSLLPDYLANDASKNMFDLQIGVNYSGVLISDALFLNVGFSLWHINRAKSNFLEEGGRVSIKYVTYAGLTWRSGAVGMNHSTGGVSEVSGTVSYINQASSQLLEISALYRYFLGSNISIGGGLAFRTLSYSNVFSPFVVLDLYSFTLDLQFDLQSGTGSSVNNLFAIGLGYRF